MSCHVMSCLSLSLFHERGSKIDRQMARLDAIFWMFFFCIFLLDFCFPAFCLSLLKKEFPQLWIPTTWQESEDDRRLRLYWPQSRVFPTLEAALEAAGTAGLPGCKLVIESQVWFGRLDPSRSGRLTRQYEWSYAEFRFQLTKAHGCITYVFD